MRELGWWGIMPHFTVNGVRLWCSDEGSGAETVVFSHGLLLSGAMFSDQIAHLKQRYRCIAYDHRGQGGSEVTAKGYDIETLTADTEALITALDAAPCHFVGLSMGGFVGLRLAVRRPDLLKSLTLIDTSADPEPSQNVPRYRMLNFVARWFGLRMVVGKVMPIMFGHTFLGDPVRAAERKLWRQRIMANDRIGITRAVNGVIYRKGVIEDIKAIQTPTLIIVGEEDVATVPEKSERMHAAIAGSRLIRVARAGHSSTIEEPHAVNEALSEFLAGKSCCL